MPLTQINAIDALELLQKDRNSVLIDVRTNEEFNMVGIANTSSFEGRMILLPWKTLPAMEENPEFATDLESALQKKMGDGHKESRLIFICKSGGRSNQAASHAVNLGYKICYNLISGFEGDLNQKEQRGKLNGWKAENLPWRQS